MSGELARLSDRDPIVTEARVATFPFQHDWQELVEYMERLGEILSDGDRGDVVLAGSGTSWTLDHTVSHAWTATQDFSRVTSGVGEQFSPNHGNPAVGGPHVEGSVLNIERGTTAAPDTTLQTPLKVSRVLQVTDADLAALSPPAGTVGDQYLAAIAGFCKGTTLTTVQPIGVFGAGINYGQTNDATLANTRPDGLGVAGYGYTAGPGGGIGGYFDGSRALATGYCGGIEVVVRNLAGAGNPAAYDPLNHKSCGVWVITSGDADIGAGVLIGQFSGQQFEVGFGILGTVVSGKTGGVRVASFRDDGNATIVFDVNGSHTNGLDASGATFSSHAILLASGHTQSWGDVGLKRGGAGVLSVTDGGAGAGSVTTENLTVTGDATLGNAETDTVTVAGMLRLTSDEPASPTSTQHPMQIGPTAADNLVFGDNNIQARDNGVASTLNLNGSGSRVELSGGAASFDSVLGHTIDGNLTFGSSVLFSNVTEATLSSTAHALQVGTTASTNLAFDTTEIQARNNGAASTLELNPHGGSVTIGGVALLGVTDGDKGDITVSASGATWIVDNDAITYAKMQNVSATDKVLGRSTAGAGDVEEISTTGSGNVVRATSPTITAGIWAGTTNVSGGQLQFPATQSASADVNTLDDYEEGTFTPVLAFGGGTTGITYTEQFGRYTKIGRAVLYEVRILLSSKGSDAGTAAIAGLPFTSAATAATGGAVRANTMTTVAVAMWRIGASSTTISLDDFSGSVTASLTNADFTNTSSLIFSGHYTAAA